MPRRPAPLPARLRDQAFLATQPDIARHRVRAGDLWTPTRGTRLPVHRIDVESQCRAHLLTLPAGAAFSHETAAALWGLPGPRRADPPMHITTPAGVRAPRRHSVIGHQAALGTHEVRWLRGLPVTSPARTFLDLATVRDVVDLVAAGDRIISRRAPLSSWEDLADAARRSPGTRGIRTASARGRRMRSSETRRASSSPASISPTRSIALRSSTKATTIATATSGGATSHAVGGSKPSDAPTSR